jgi:hypothetical protein
MLTGTAQSEGALTELRAAIEQGEEFDKKRAPAPMLYGEGIRAEVVSPSVGAISGSGEPTEVDKAYQDWIDHLNGARSRAREFNFGV